MAVLVLSIILAIAIAILITVSMWKLFERNNVKGWKVLIPIYNLICILKISNLPIWYLVFAFIPILNIIFSIIVIMHFTYANNRGSYFGIGVVLLPFVFLPIMAFQKERKSYKKSKTLPVVLFVVAILLVVLLATPWESLFTKFTAFSDFNNTLKGITLGKYEVFSAIVGSPKVADMYGTSGSIPAIGSWALNDFSILLIILSVVIALANKIKLDDFIDAEKESIKKYLPIAVIAMLISIVLVVFVTTGINITFTHALLSLSKKFNIVTTILGSFVGSLTTMDSYYYISTLGPIFTKVITDTNVYGLVAFIMQSIYSVLLMIAPTSVALMLGLYTLDIPYGKWIKYIWKVVVALLVIVIITSIILFVLI